MELRRIRRDRAARLGPELFLFERAFEDCLERIEILQRWFDDALLVGSPDPGWRARVPAREVAVIDPGPLFAGLAAGEVADEDRWEPRQTFDLIIAIGTLDTVNDLQRALSALCNALRSDGLFIGALSGGDTLPQLRSAMRAADAARGIAAPHVHPRIEPAALSPLLEQAGFVRPVVDVDRVTVSYRSLGALVADLRKMAGTNVLKARPKQALSKTDSVRAADHFSDLGKGERTNEVFEIVHFAAWKPTRS